ncbi:hypothetical protein [Sulfurospirillum oryzae]|uniref:hypothetical protein n=1 Tax=Sulfurospirillum oryzae TaxID=2976535 RepID=UPI0021E76D31|nr:hypothetical protein [Sulfurospirillum oryzae]
MFFGKCIEAIAPQQSEREIKNGGKLRGIQKKDEHTLNVQRVKESLSLHVKAKHNRIFKSASY